MRAARPCSPALQVGRVGPRAWLTYPPPNASLPSLACSCRDRSHLPVVCRGDVRHPPVCYPSRCDLHSMAARPACLPLSRACSRRGGSCPLPVCCRACQRFSFVWLGGLRSALARAYQGGLHSSSVCSCGAGCPCPFLPDSTRTLAILKPSSSSTRNEKPSTLTVSPNSGLRPSISKT